MTCAPSLRHLRAIHAIVPLADFELWRALFLIEPAEHSAAHVAQAFVRDFLAEREAGPGNSGLDGSGA